MKKVSLLRLCLFAFLMMAIQTSYSQFYLGLNSGINNFNGLIGVSGTYQKEELGFRFGIGSGGWGAKLSAGVSYHNFWLSYANAKGFDLITQTLETTVGDQSVDLKMKPASLVDVSWAKYWGKRVVRFNIEVGYSIRVAGASYEVLNGYTLSDFGKKVMNMSRPGGVKIGIGLAFKIGQ